MASKKTTSKGVVKSTKRPTPPALQSDMVRHGTKRNSFIKTKYMNLENGEREKIKEATVYTVGKRSIEPHNKNSKKTDVLLKQNLYYEEIPNPKFKDSATGRALPVRTVPMKNKAGKVMRDREGNIKMKEVPDITHLKGKVIYSRKDKVFRRLNAKELEERGLSEAIEQVNAPYRNKSGKIVTREFKEGTKQINRARARYKEDYKVQSRWY